MVEYGQLYSLTQKLKILYIEDDIDFRNETSDIFRDLFSSVDLCIDGESGLEKYLQYYQSQSTYYDIVITDINMPKLDGIELIKRIYEQNSSQLIIVISAYNDSEYLMELVNMGIEQFLLKPLDQTKVFNVLYNSAKKLLVNNLKAHEQIEIVLSDNYSWNKSEEILYKNGESVKLTNKEHLLLKLFIKNGSKISTLQEIYNTIWPYDPQNGSQDSLKPMISRFRKKIPENKIESIYKLGYKLIF